MQERRRTLQDEYEKGLRKLEELDRSRRDLEKTLLRISGAIQVLDELGREPTARVESQADLRAVAK